MPVICKNIYNRYFLLFMKKICSIILTTALAVSCTIAPKDRLAGRMTSGLARIACDEEFENLMESEIASFCGIYDSAYVIPDYRNETETLRLLSEDSVRMAIATRDVSDRERRMLDEKNLVVHKSTIAFDGVALLTSPNNLDSLLTLSQIRQILRGEITDWAQINPKNSAGPIRILFDNRQSGVFRYVIETILDKNIEKINPNLYELGSTATVIDKTSELPNALAFVASNHISNEYRRDYAEIRRKIRPVRISAQSTATLDNSYLPYAGDIITENYPLWRKVFVLVTDPQSSLPSGFAVFLAKNEIGQKIIQKAGLLAIQDVHNLSVEITDEMPQQQ